MNNFEYESSESGNWNFAKDFSLLLSSILKDITLYDDIAIFGTSTLIEDFQIPEDLKTIARINSLKRINRLIYKLSKLSIKFLKNKDQSSVEVLKTRINGLYKVISCAENRMTKKGKTFIQVNEENFEKIQRFQDDILVELLDYMNKAELIFTGGSEIDPKIWKESLKTRMKTRG